MAPRPISIWRSLWRYSFLVTAPLTIVTLLWLLPSVQMIRSFRVIHTAPYADIALESPKIMWANILALMERWRSGWPLIPASSPLPVYEIQIAPERLARLRTRLPSSGANSVKARIQFPDGRIHHVKARFRGDNLNHWGFPVQSWRVRMRDGLIDGRRTFDFILPRWRSALSYYLPLRMAAELGLLASRPEFVFLSVNGRIRGGVHLAVDVVDESFLRRRGRMPGDIFVGDMILADGRVREERSAITMWAIPDAWRKTAENNQFAKGSMAPLEELFLRIAAATDAKGHLKLMDMLDVEQWARLAAWIQLTGAVHFDLDHNWVLLFDAARQRFEPIVRDGNALTDNILTSDAPVRDLGISAPILAVLHRDHEFLRLKKKIIADFFRDGKDLLLLAEADQVGARLRAALLRSKQLDWMDSEPRGSSFHYVSAGEFSRRLLDSRKTMTQWFDLQRATAILKPADFAATLVSDEHLRLRISGSAPISSIAIPLSLGNTPSDVCLAIRLDTGIETCTSIYSYVDLRPGLVTINLPMLAQNRIRMSQHVSTFANLEIGPATYDIVMRGQRIDRAHEIVVIGPDGSRYPASPAEPIDVVPMPTRTRQIVPVAFPSQIWSGTMNIRDSIEIRGDLVIKPGTKLLLGPAVNVTVRGRVLAEGLPTEPIVVQRLDDRQPWGAFTVLGKDASHSRFRHCIFDGGSGYKGPYTLYSGMFNVHDVNELEVSDCVFRNNSEFDDLIHLVYVTGLMTNVVVENAVADGIDIDIGRMVFDNLTVRNTGNDALDLMTSQVTVRNSNLSRAADKGISVGENSTVRVENTLIADNVTGIEVKDGSKAYTQATAYTNNRVHVSGYHKNARYVGNPLIVIDRSSIGTSVEEPIKLQDGAEAILADTTFETARTFRGVIVDPPSASLAWKKLQDARQILEMPNAR